MQIEYKTREKIVGVFIVTIAMLLLTTVVLIGRGQDWFKTYITYYTNFNEGYNLQNNAAVKLFKTDIGKVRKITLEGNRVKVKLGILEEYAHRIRTDSIASVESPTFIGDEYVSIKPGTPGAAQIPPEGEIQSIEKKSIEEYLEEFELEKTSKMVIQALQDLSQIAQVLRDPQGPLFSTLDNLNRIVADIQAGKGSVGSLLKSRELLENLIDKMDRVGDILENIQLASDRAPETMALVNENLTQFRDISGDVSRGVADIQSIITDVEESVQKLKTTLANVEKGSRDIPQITRTTKVGIQEIRDGVKRIDRVFQAVQKNVLIRSDLPPDPKGESIDAGLRP